MHRHVLVWITIQTILWLMFASKNTQIVITACICYLTPQNSARSTDGSDFYETLLGQMYVYQDIGQMFICGDLNSRCGDNTEYIEGVDSIIHRDVVDFDVNSYDESLIDFLISSNFCILNGRNHINNDFTSIVATGKSVVDYCLVPHEDLTKYSKFKFLG